MRMPIATNKKSTTDELNIEMNNTKKELSTSKESSNKTDRTVNAIQKIIDLVEKKIRNLEKRRLKLQQYQIDQSSGRINLTDGQLVAVSKMGEVEQQIEFAKDMLKSVELQLKEQQKADKEAQRRENKERQLTDTSRLRDLMQYQELLNIMGKQEVKNSFENGTDGAVKLTLEELSLCDQLYELLCPNMEEQNSKEWEQKLDNSALIANNLLNSSSRPIINDQNGKSLKNLLDRISACEFILHAQIQTETEREQSPALETQQQEDKEDEQEQEQEQEQEKEEIGSRHEHDSRPPSVDNTPPMVFVSNGQAPVSNYPPISYNDYNQGVYTNQSIADTYVFTTTTPEPTVHPPFESIVLNSSISKPLDPNAPSFISDDDTNAASTQQKANVAVDDQQGREGGWGERRGRGGSFGSYRGSNTGRGGGFRRGMAAGQHQQSGRGRPSQGGSRGTRGFPPRRNRGQFRGSDQQQY